MKFSRTILFAVLLAVLSAAELHLQMFATVLPDWAVGVAGIVIAGAIAYLRLITTQSLFPAALTDQTNE